MVPSPESAAGCQAFSEHSGQNVRGGMARAPQRLQRTATSSPAPALSKNSFCVSIGSLATEERHQHGGGVAAQRVGEADAGAVYLAPAGVVTELGDDLGDLGGAGGADRMALGLEPARGIHGNLAAEAGPALLGRHAAGAGLEEPQPLGGHDLGDRE